MLDNTTKKRIDNCRDILVGKLPDPKSQIEQITIALIYKFMDDMDKESIELGGAAKFFSANFAKYSWDSLFDTRVTATEMLKLYQEAIESMEKNPNIPQLFRDIFKNAYLPYRDPETLKLFLKTIGEFEYTHSEKLGDAFEYLLSVMGSQGDAGQFRTPRHIIDFLVKAVDPDKSYTILDPACGTAGFLISAFKHIMQSPSENSKTGEHNKPGERLLTPDEHKRVIRNFIGYDISPDMVRLSLVNLYLHGFSDPHIFEYDTLTSEERWDDSFDVILANPPFMSPKGGIRPHKRFTVTSNRSEVLFVDYIAEHLNPKGRAGIIVPEGIIFQSGKAYKELRKMLVENSLYAVVSLPAGVFNPYSGVKPSILLMDREIAAKTDEIMFIKIDNDGYNLGAQRNEIKGGQLGEAIEILKKYKEEKNLAANARMKTEEKRESIISALAAKSDISHIVKKSKIAGNGDYNLSGERYKEILDTRNSEFPMVELGEVCEVYDDKRIPITKSDRKSGIYPYYGASGIVDYVSDYIFDEDILLISEDGANLRARVTPIAFSVSGKCWVNNHAHVVKFKNFVTQKFVELYLNSISIDKYVTGAAQPKLNQKALKSLQIPLPPLSVQEEIVAEIEGYQKIIDGAKMIVDNYKPKININPDWKMVELGEIAKLVGGGTPSKKVDKYWEGGDINWVSCSDFTSNAMYLSDSIRKITHEGLINSSSNLVDKETLILVTRVSLGKLAFTSNKTAINQDLTALIFDNDKINKFYGYFYLLSIADKIEQDGNGVTVKGVTRDYVKKIKIPLPPLNEQKQIVAKIAKEQELVNANKELITIFEQKIKDTIAKVWGEGEISH